MDSSWSDAEWDAPLDPLDAQEIESAIDAASHCPVPGIDSGAPDAAEQPGWDAEASWSGTGAVENPMPSAPGHNLSEEEAAALLVELMSKSAVYKEDGSLRVEPDPSEVEKWNDEKRQDVNDIIGQVVGQPENVKLIADALEIENARLEDLMAQYEDAVAQAGYDDEAPEVIALADEIQDLHAKIQDLAEQYLTLAGLPVPGMPGARPLL